MKVCRGEEGVELLLIFENIQCPRSPGPEQHTVISVFSSNKIPPSNTNENI